MTPTLLGRWQIRLFLLPTVGLLISLVVSLVLQSLVPLLALLYVLLFGLVWDVLYQLITSYRWDRDWPTSFQVAAGIIEGVLVWVILIVTLPEKMRPSIAVFLIQYGLIWLSIFLLTQGPLRIFWVNWRYQGGQWFVSRRVQAGQYAHQQPPAPAPQRYNVQAVGANYPPPPVAPPPPAIGAGYPQPPVTLPPAIPTGYADRPQSHGGSAGSPPAAPYICTCGFVDHSTGNFCARCGRPKVQQGFSY